MMRLETLVELKFLNPSFSSSKFSIRAFRAPAANLRTKILDVRGLDSIVILNSRGGIVRSVMNFPEGLSQAILVGRFSVGRLGVQRFSLGLEAPGRTRRGRWASWPEGSAVPQEEPLV